jgi:hypothetical protein
MEGLSHTLLETAYSWLLIDRMSLHGGGPGVIYAWFSDPSRKLHQRVETLARHRI